MMSDFFSLEMVLLLWTLVSVFLHELGHIIIAKLLNYKILAIFFVFFPGVVIEIPEKKSHSDLILAGGYIVSLISIFLFMPVVSSEERVVFIITAFVISSFLSISDFAMIIATRKHKVCEVWIQSMENLINLHNKVSKYGFSNFIVFEEEKFKKIFEFNQDNDRISIVLLKDSLTRKGLAFCLFITLTFMLVISINWPMFWMLSNVFKVKIEISFLLYFLIVFLINIILIVSRYILIWREIKK